MSKLTFDAGMINLTQLSNGRPYVCVHTEYREAETTARYWPVDERRVDPYIALKTATPEGDVTTFMTLDQAEAMRDALTAALEEAAADTAQRVAS